MTDSSSSLSHQRRFAFTLVELLIVIGIISLLISLLLPAVSKIRIASQRVATQSTLNRLSAACEIYTAAFSSYPGVIRNEITVGSVTSPDTPPSFAIAPSTTPNPVNVTSTENMLLSLIGGLSLRASVITYDVGQVGSGSASLNANRPGRNQPYLEVRSNELTTNYNDLGGQWGTADSIVPEILDGFASPRPILYLRANRGNAGLVASSGTPAPTVAPQYDVRQLYAYGFPDDSDGSFTTANPADTSAGLAAGVESYFGNHELSRPSALVVRQKDSYIIISAGPDGRFGTTDDIRN